MRLQCFRPRAHINVTTFTNFLTKLKFRLPACIVWFHYVPSSIIWWFLDNFFFCLVFRSPCYTLSRKKKKILIIGTLGSGWDRKFYMGAQNGSNAEIWPSGILIHALESKLRPFEFPHMFVQGSHAFAMFPPTRAHKRDDLYQLFDKIKI